MGSFLCGGTALVLASRVLERAVQVELLPKVIGQPSSKLRLALLAFQGTVGGSLAILGSEEWLHYRQAKSLIASQTRCALCHSHC
jgi:hypothetical protein